MGIGFSKTGQFNGRIRFRNIPPSPILNFLNNNYVSYTSYTGKNYVFGSAVENNPTGIHFKPDGTKFFMIGAVSDNIVEFNLSTPWDVTTATQGNSYYVGSFETAPQDIFFKPDGTRIYILGSLGKLRQFDLTTPWDITTISTGGNFITTRQDASGMYFKPDGTKVFVVSYTDDAVFEYDLSTPWDITTGTYANKSFSVASEDPEPHDVFFDNDGKSFYIVGRNRKIFVQYEMTVPWDITTASLSDRIFYLGSEDSSPQGVYMKSDGKSFYVIGAGTFAVYQYDVSLPWTINLKLDYVASYNTGFSQSKDIFFKPDGTRYFLVSDSANRVYQFDLSTPWDITTTVSNGSFYVGSQSTSPTGLFFKDDGTKMYVVGSSSGIIYQYSLTTPWDVTTAAYENKSLNVSSYDGVPVDIVFTSDGTKMFFYGTVNDKMFQFSLSVPWDISTATYGNKEQYFGNYNIAMTAIWFRNDGKRLFLVGSASPSKNLFVFSLSSPWDFTTATKEIELYIGTHVVDAAYGLAFGNEGKNMYIMGYNGTLHQFGLEK